MGLLGGERGGFRPVARGGVSVDADQNAAGLDLLALDRLLALALGVDAWRHEQAFERTRRNRPDLLSADELADD